MPRFRKVLSPNIVNLVWHDIGIVLVNGEPDGTALFCHGSRKYPDTMSVNISDFRIAVDLKIESVIFKHPNWSCRITMERAIQLMDRALQPPGRDFKLIPLVELGHTTDTNDRHHEEIEW